jgi:hypothetical protein
VLAGDAVVDLVVDATKHRLVLTHAQTVELLTKVAFDQKLVEVVSPRFTRSAAQSRGTRAPRPGRSPRCRPAR